MHFSSGLREKIVRVLFAPIRCLGDEVLCFIGFLESGRQCVVSLSALQCMGLVPMGRLGVNDLKR